MSRQVVIDQDEWEEFPEERRRRGGWAFVFLMAIFLMLVLAVGGYLYVNRKINPPGSPGEDVALTIPKGSATPAIARLLEDQDVITDARIFRYYIRVTGGGPFQAGEYTLQKKMNMGDVVKVLDQGPQIRYVRLTIPEGFILERIAERVGTLPGRSAEKFLELARSGTIRSRYQPAGSNNLEGLLLADTYTLEEKDDEAAILKRMIAGFESAATEAGIEENIPGGLSAYQAIIVASLIEREARTAEDRPKISRVIYNRLGKKMKLDIDASVRYGLKKFEERLLFKDLEIDTPYNTYRRPGLPPTPIAAPGREALKAALNPVDGPWLYYVASGDGTGGHVFSTTLAEHNRAVAEARKKGVTG